MSPQVAVGVALLVVAIGIVAFMLVRGAGRGGRPPEVSEGVGVATPPPSGREAGARAAPWEPFSELVGVRLDPADGRSLHLVGVGNRTLLALSPSRLADYFAVCLRSYDQRGRAPALSIDPTPEQVRQGAQRMSGPQTVRYEGGCEGTWLGLMTFAADRRMKCLSHGKDNVTQAPVSLPVAGYQNTLDRMLATETVRENDVGHRLWIEPETATAGVKEDRSYVSLSVAMHVAVKRQAIRDGELVDIDVEPDPVTLAFATHMTEQYLQFAAADPTFAEVKAAAQMALLARVVWERATNADAADDLAVDYDWWLHSYPVQPVWTPKTTPVGRAHKSTSQETRRAIPGGVETTTSTQTVYVAGGVDLEAKAVEQAPPGEVSAPAGSTEEPAGSQSAQPSGRQRRRTGPVMTCKRQDTGEIAIGVEGSGEVVTLGSQFLDSPLPSESPSLDKLRERLAPIVRESGGEGSERIVCSPGYERPGLVQSQLAKADPKIAFAGRDQGRAQMNYERLEDLAGKPRRLSVVIERESLNAEQRRELLNYGLDVRSFPQEQWLTSAKDVPEDADVVVIVGERGETAPGQAGPLIKDVQQAHGERRLEGKVVICFLCGSEGFERVVNSMFDDPAKAPACVYAFLGPVDAATIPDLLSTMSRKLASDRTMRPDELVDKSLQELIDSPETEGKPKVREGARGMLQQRYKQLSRRWPEGGSPESPDAAV